MKKRNLQMKFSVVSHGEQGAALTTALDLATLESHLWEAANILRGPVDAADFKTYIFPLLFFKRISDVYDEEVKAALAESGGDQEYASFPENHRFQIPAGCHWNDVREQTTNIGQALQRATREIEQANQRTLYAIFGDAQWTNKERLSDALLADLLDHFSRLPLSNGDVDSDVLGQAYEYLIKKGLIWHFQGSGKSLLMVFAAQKLRSHPALKNPTVLIVVDRIDLDTQITATFNAADVPNMQAVDKRETLQTLLAQDTRKVLITTIHKFAEAPGVLNAQIQAASGAKALRARVWIHPRVLLSADCWNNMENP